MVPHYLKGEIYSPYQLLANTFGPGARMSGHHRSFQTGIIVRIATTAIAGRASWMTMPKIRKCPAPSTKRAEISSEIDRIVMTALDRDPARRYATAAAMVEDIETVAHAERHQLSASAMGRIRWWRGSWTIRCCGCG